ncbi:MAG: hypothetical protein NTU81_03345 [Candidatus Nomurabacteria bacterium]|nr:hypothetical protein [Candidatus Nomurabacteria bacterium]
MISKYRHKELTWIDLEAPKEEETLHILEQYSIPLSIEDEIRMDTDESKTIMNSGYIFTSLHLPQILNEESIVLNNKIIFVIHNNFILTIHEKPVVAFREFLNNLEIDTTLPEQLQIKHTDLLSYYLIKSLYINLKEQLSENDNQINEIENKIIKSNNENISITIFKKNKISIDIEKNLFSHDKILKNMSVSLVQIFGEKFENYSLSIIEEFTQIKLILNVQNKNLINLSNLNNSITTNQYKKKFKLLTTLSLISLIVIISISIYVISHI